MDKATMDRYQLLINKYRQNANKLDITLSEYLLLTLSEQMRDIAETFIEYREENRQ